MNVNGTDSESAPPASAITIVPTYVPETFALNVNPLAKASAEVSTSALVSVRSPSSASVTDVSVVASKSVEAIVISAAAEGAVVRATVKVPAPAGTSASVKPEFPVKVTAAPRTVS